MSSLTSVFVASLKQQNKSHRFYSIRWRSKAKAGKKNNIQKAKSVITAIPATRQNDCNAGISVYIPMKKARASQNPATKIDGPTSYKANAILSSGFVINLGTILSALEIRNILSTPIAKIKKGTTSREIIVSFSLK